jgi:hypothetical protein
MVTARPAIDEMKNPKGVEPRRKTLSIKQRDHIKNIKISVAYEKERTIDRATRSSSYTTQEASQS